MALLFVSRVELAATFVVGDEAHRSARVHPDDGHAVEGADGGWCGVAVVDPGFVFNAAHVGLVVVERER